MTDGRRQTVDGRELHILDEAVDDGQGTMDDARGMDRRDVVKIIAAASLAAVGIGAPEIAAASEHAHEAMKSAASSGAAFAPKFFSADEYRMVRSLADYVIPRDARSGSASDAGVPEFMDFIMREYPNSQKWMRDGLAWTNAECRKRFNHTWASCTPAQHKLLLDDIAFPKKAPAALKGGVDFFTRFRDLTSSGFWTSRIGVKDLGYMGNTAIMAWTGCPQPVLKKLGVSYKTSMHVPKRG